MYQRTAISILAFTPLSLLGVNLFIIAPRASPGPTTQGSQEQTMTKTKDAAPRESPFACNVRGLNTEQRRRYSVLIKKLKSTTQEVKEITDGYAFRFAAESSVVQDLAEFIVYERLCCPFFDFELAVEREGGPAWLRLRGREGVKEFIRLEFGVK